jgi:hypothetical protein
MLTVIHAQRIWTTSLVTVAVMLVVYAACVAIALDSYSNVPDRTLTNCNDPFRGSCTQVKWGNTLYLMPGAITPNNNTTEQTQTNLELFQEMCIHNVLIGWTTKEDVCIIDKNLKLYFFARKITNWLLMISLVMSAMFGAALASVLCFQRWKLNRYNKLQQHAPASSSSPKSPQQQQQQQQQETFSLSTDEDIELPKTP